ncbi:MAG: hypothetical protein Q8L48_41350 [Archangium sp.]|nr:hypothetical protein [Archangium sp.]
MSQEQHGKGGSADQKKPAAAPAKGTAAPRTATGSIPAQGNPGAAVSEYSTSASILTKTQKSQLGSQFADSSAERKRSSVLGTSMPSAQAVAAAAAEEEVSTVGMKFDGKDVPKVLQGRDVWIAVQAPLQSREGKRSAETYEMLIKQFGVTVNPRYSDDAPGKIRGHIFVWDVSRAMNCEIPHFVGAKELTLAQTCDWLRHEGPMRGWKRVSGADIFEAANSGRLVIALPRETRTKHLAVVLPQAMPDDGSPRLTGICLKRDVSVHPREMFGAKPVDCFYHD